MTLLRAVKARKEQTGNNNVKRTPRGAPRKTKKKGCTIL